MFFTLIYNLTLLKIYINNSNNNNSEAFDSMPHSWLKEMLQIYKITTEIILALNTMMKEW